MKIALQVLTIFLFSTTIVYGQLKDYHDDMGIVLMKKISLRQFIDELKISKGEIDEEAEFKHENKILIHRLHTSGQQDSSWISDNDLEYLMTLIDSEDPAKCIIRSISSNKTQPQRTTLGDQAILLLYAYKERLSFPHEFNICGENAKFYKSDIIDWWRKRE
tara:strand:+ start:795 stop:1280 length:486 start_codon:yes stop_codon:yes gene_type:complete